MPYAVLFYDCVFAAETYIIFQNRKVFAMNEFLKNAPPAPGNSVVRGEARFSVITPHLIRMEWSPDRKFDDRPTQNIRCRDLGPQSFRTSEENGVLHVDTGALQLEYHPDGKPFSSGNLKIFFRFGNRTVAWTPGMADSGNLKGACTELDMLDGDVLLDLMKWVNGTDEVRAKFKLDDGFLSRSGWSLFDDSETAAVVEHPVFGEWFEQRSASGRVDLYFFAFGTEYKKCLLVASRMFGRPPLPPHYAFGYWYSRYWAFSDTELEELAEHFDREGTPLDVLVLDVDWHLPGWTGFTWDPDFFPDPGGFLRKIKTRNIHTALNLHPDRGVAPHEKCFAEFAACMNHSDPDSPVPFDIGNPRFMDLYFKKLLNPEELRGVDCWWMDWRQDSSAVERTGFRPLAWINRLHWLDQERRNPEKRPIVFSCRGGMDGVRYPIGFSADACSTWATLAKEIEITSAASNVLFGYWSHDIGGHMEHSSISPELYLRWMQFGVCSPVFRTHSAKFAYAERRFWNFPAPWNGLLRKEIRRRLRLVPYIYGECRKACDSAVSLCRPLYYEYPELDEAYRHPGEYFFGDSFLAAPVSIPADPETGLAEQNLWLPPGEWYDLETGLLLSGGQKVLFRRLHSDLPRLVRPGTVLAEAPEGERAGVSAVLPHPVFVIYPGSQGEYELYEDDGSSVAYERGECVRTRIRHRREGLRRIVEIAPAEGVCAGWLEERPVTVKFRGYVPPVSVEVDGKRIPWSYDGSELTCSISLPLMKTREGVRLEIEFAEEDEYASLAGWRGAVRRLRLLADIQNRTAGCTMPVKDDRLAQKLAHLTRRISLHPETLPLEQVAVKELFPRLAPSFRELQRVRGKLFPFSLKQVDILLKDTERLMNNCGNRTFVP